MSSSAMFCKTLRFKFSSLGSSWVNELWMGLNLLSFNVLNNDLRLMSCSYATIHVRQLGLFNEFYSNIHIISNNLLSMIENLRLLRFYLSTTLPV